MKKRICLILTLVLVFPLILTACSSQGAGKICYQPASTGEGWAIGRYVPDQEQGVVANTIYLLLAKSTSDVKFGEEMDAEVTEYVIPETTEDGEPITEIGSDGFRDWTTLQKLTVPGSVKRIGSRAFAGCTGLEVLQIREGVTEIGAHAFEGCDGLMTIIIPSSVTSIGDYAFPASATNPMISVFYAGTQEEWDNIQIGEGNDMLKYVVKGGHALPDSTTP